MAKTTSEATPLLYGTGSGQQTSSTTRSDAKAQSRRWKLAASGAALLCAGTLVTSKLQQSTIATSSSSLDTILGAGVSLNRQSVEAIDEPPVGPATADFFAAMKAFKNENADPCVDFYEYACGGWLATNEIPSDGATVDSAFYVVSEDNKKIVRKIIDSKPPVISEFYESCLNSPDVDTEAVAYVSKRRQRR